MTINVYWSRSNPNWRETIAMSSLRLLPPEPLMKNIDYKDFFGPEVSKCPAIVDDLKNIFVIKSPVDLTISVTGSNIQIMNQVVEFGQMFLGPNQGKVGIHQLGMGYYFFAEKSLVATQLPAYYEANGFTDNTHMISASFDIGKWFRVAGKPIFAFKEGDRVMQIKEGDALMYYKFNTVEKVKLVEVEATPILQSLASTCGALKFHSQGITPLAKCYEYFENFNMRHKILKEIKSQRLE